MNDQRRKAIAKITTALAGYVTDIEGLRDEEQETLDNMPDGLKDGEKGELAQNALDCLEEAASNLQEVVEKLEEASA